MNRKILVVDDDKKTAELIRLYLEQDGYRVLLAHDGRAALELAPPARPRPDRARPDAAPGGRAGRVPHPARRVAGADHHAHRPHHRGRQAARPRPGRRRLRDQAVQPARSGGAGARGAAARGRRGRRRRAGDGPPRRPAGGLCPPRGPSRTARPCGSRPRSSSCWKRWRKSRGGPSRASTCWSACSAWTTRGWSAPWTCM